MDVKSSLKFSSCESASAALFILPDTHTKYCIESQDCFIYMQYVNADVLSLANTHIYVHLCICTRLAYTLTQQGTGYLQLKS